MVFHRGQCWVPCSLRYTVGRKLNEFADNMKVGGVVDSDVDCQRQQQNIDQLKIWMEYNPNKWKVKHFEKSNRGRISTLNGKVLNNIDEKRYLAVQAGSTM